MRLKRDLLVCVLLVFIFGQLIVQLMLTSRLHNELKRQLAVQENRFKDLADEIALLKERAESFAVCGDATSFAARYDFGLKMKNETYVPLPDAEALN